MTPDGSCSPNLGPPLERIERWIDSGREQRVWDEWAGSMCVRAPHTTNNVRECAELNDFLMGSLFVRPIEGFGRVPYETLFLVRVSWENKSPSFSSVSCKWPIDS